MLEEAVGIRGPQTAEGPITLTKGGIKLTNRTNQGITFADGST